MAAKAKKKAVKRKTPKSETMLGWYFAEASECLRYEDGRKIVVGKSHSVKGKPVLCENGLHASKTVWDALSYAPGPILYRVELSGKFAHDETKSCATTRRYIQKIDATKLLREFARKCALKVIHLWDAPRVVKDYLETGDETIRDAARAAARAAAWDAARAAAWDAARAAAWDAARDAARAAAWDAARNAARAAAWDAARAAAWDAARAAAWDAARNAARDAAWDAARAAAWDAARNAAQKEYAALLEEMVLAAFAKAEA